MAFGKSPLSDELWDGEMMALETDGQSCVARQRPWRRPCVRGFLPSSGNEAESGVFTADRAYLLYPWMGV